MPKATSIVATVENGTIESDKAQFIRGQIALYEGGEVQIRLNKPKRSSKANSYYWAGVIGPIREAALEAGMTHPTKFWHELFKQRYLEPRVFIIEIDDGEKEVILPPTTTGLDSTAFHDYIEHVKLDEDVLGMGVYFEDFSTHTIA